MLLWIYLGSYLCDPALNQNAERLRSVILPSLQSLQCELDPDLSCDVYLEAGNCRNNGSVVPPMETAERKMHNFQEIRKLKVRKT